MFEDRKGRGQVDPRGGVKNTIGRGEEKTRLLLEWVASFQFTTVAILAKRMGVSENTALRFVQKMKARDIVRGVPSGVVRSELIMLTAGGADYCAQMVSQLFTFVTKPSKLTYGRILHNLAVQKAVVARVGRDTPFWGERQLRKHNWGKTPDAMIEHEDLKWVYEVELTAKEDKRIYIAFQRHIKGLFLNRYDRVVYAFEKQNLLDYYKARFDAEKWVVYQSKKIGWGVRRDEKGEPEYYYPADDAHIAAKFSFELV